MKSSTVATALTEIWYRSIQVRVVTTTVVLTALIIGLIGWAVLARVSSGVVDGRRDAAIAEARSGFAVAQSQFDAAVQTDASTQAQTLNELLDRFSGPSDSSDERVVVLEGPIRSGSGQSPVRSSRAIDTAVITAGLRRQIATDTQVRWQYATLENDLGAEPAVVIGRSLRSPATGDSYEMYFVFSLSDQAQTLGLVRQALIVGGLAMVVLLGLLSWAVSRQILNPVRLARRIAERFAAGSLEQRMHVRGRDDLARLSISFNQMASSLQRQIRRLEHLSRLQQRFVSDVSHELRTPLTTVRMASDVLHDSRDNLGPSEARSAELLKRELDRFEDLLANLLDLSRFDAGAVQLEIDRVDLSALVRAAVADPLMERADLQVRLLGAESPAVVEADARRVERILRNLLANAIKYSGSERLEIEIGRSSDRVSVVVRDFGIGLGGDENLRVFDRFWRADAARTPGGTGLGLAIAREDAALHGGRLEAFGRRGEGAEFVLTLPRTVPRDGSVVHGPTVGLVFA